MNDIDNLVALLSKLPGIGKLSARRIVVRLIQKKDKIMYPLSNTMLKLADSIKHCQLCNNLGVEQYCDICSNSKRDNSVVCVVESVLDLWAIEKSKTFKGVYHVLEGRLSASNTVYHESLNIDSLVDRVEQGNIKEVIIASNNNPEGQTTAFYISDMLSKYDITISRIAQGIPFGGEINYLDEGTLDTAIKSRIPFL